MGLTGGEERAACSSQPRKAYQERIPLKRIGRPEDIARTTRFLLSTDVAYITAAEIVVDGGTGRTTFRAVGLPETNERGLAGSTRKSSFEGASKDQR